MLVISPTLPNGYKYVALTTSREQMRQIFLSQFPRNGQPEPLFHHDYLQTTWKAYAIGSGVEGIYQRNPMGWGCSWVSKI